MRVVRNLLGRIARYSDRVESCKENVRRNIRYLIELRVVRKFVRRIPRYLIELRAVRCLLEGFQGI